MQTIQAAYLNLRVSANQIDTGQNVPRPLFNEDDFCVSSLVLSNCDLIFDVCNLTAGDYFLIAHKKSLDEEFTNYWVPEWGFAAPAANIGLSIPLPSDSENGFYRFVDYNRYYGPDLKITAPDDNSTVSGTIQVKCSLTDIFQPLAAEPHIGVASLEAFYDAGDDAYISKFAIEGSTGLTWQH